MARISSPRLILWITSATFLCYGIFNAGLGPVLEEFASQAGVTVAAVGTIFSVLYGGSLLAQTISGTLTDRYGRKPIFLISTVLFSGGIVGMLSASSLPALLAWGFLTGLGQGGIDLGANLIVAEAYPHNNVPPLNILHLAFGLGAAIGPALVSLALGQFGRGMPVLLGSAVFFALLALGSLPMRMDSRAPLASARKNAPVPGLKGSVYRSPVLWLLGGLLLLVVGAQFSIGSWSTIYLTRTTTTPLETAALVTSGYWAMITAGRVAAAAASKWIAPARMLLLNLSGSLLGVLALALAHQHAVPSIAAFLFTGFCYGGLYPAVFSIAAAVFPTGSGKAASVVITMGTIGGLILPPAAGIVLENVSTFAYPAMMVGLLALMVGMWLLIVKNTSQRQLSGKLAEE